MVSSHYGSASEHAELQGQRDGGPQRGWLRWVVTEGFTEEVAFLKGVVTGCKERMGQDLPAQGWGN